MPVNSSGCFHEARIAFGLLEFVGDYIETHQLCRTERGRDSDIGGVTSLRDHDAPDPRIVVSGVEGEPASIEEHLVPCAKVHGRRIGWDADVTKVTRAVSRRDVHAAGKRDCEMSKVSADSTTFFVSFRRGAVAPGVVVSELNAVVSVVTNRLRPLPTALNASKERPREIRELFGVAVATGQ
jgi:hypothetical protein